jgi:hypothetical protein
MFPVVLADKALVTEGVDTFDKFDQHADGLDQALRMFGSSMQLLGSSVGVLHATYHLRKALMRLQFYVRENVPHYTNIRSLILLVNPNVCIIVGCCPV